MVRGGDYGVDSAVVTTGPNTTRPSAERLVGANQRVVRKATAGHLGRFRSNLPVASVYGDAIRQVTWVVIEDVPSGEWGIAGEPKTTEDIQGLLRAAGKAAE